jgi:hypothetical protein
VTLYYLGSLFGIRKFLISEKKEWFCHHHLLSVSWKSFKYSYEISLVLTVLVSFSVPYKITPNIRGVTQYSSESGHRTQIGTRGWTICGSNPGRGRDFSLPL